MLLQGEYGLIHGTDRNEFVKNFTSAERKQLQIFSYHQNVSVDKKALTIVPAERFTTTKLLTVVIS